MSEQLLLQGKILGIEEFLMGNPSRGECTFSEDEIFAGRSQWISLLCEVLPRALLAELGLARILLGSSGGGQFLLILPEEARGAAESFLSAAGEQIEALSGGMLKLVWGATENLGDWAVVRKRLNDELRRKRATPLAKGSEDVFTPRPSGGTRGADLYFGELGLKAREAPTVGWSPESPGKVLPQGGKHKWTLTPNLTADGITLARHTARSDDGHHAATTEVLARRAAGSPIWGVLRGDVDNFGIRMRRLTTIEEHVQLSVLYKQFFAGELEVACSMPEFWRKVSVLYSGGDDFAVYGSWDALMTLARELQRLFHRFTQESLNEFPGPEGKTISMALALASEPDTPLDSVFAQAGRNLDLAKSVDKNCIYLFGRVLEWKQFNDAAELKEVLTRTMSDLRLSQQFLFGLRSFYGKTARAGEGARMPLLDRGWRFHAQLGSMLGGGRDRESQKLRAQLVADIVGKNVNQPKLRPAGLVGLEWARLSTEV